MTYFSPAKVARELNVSPHTVRRVWDELQGDRIRASDTRDWRVIPASELPRLRAALAARPKPGRPRKEVAR